MTTAPEQHTMEQDLTSEQLWHDLHEKLRSFIRRRVPSEHEAEDILQEVFLRLQRHLDSLNESERVVGWVFRIATSAVADYYRIQAKAQNIEAHLRRQPAKDVTPVPSDEPDTVTELASCVTPFIQALPEPYREALTLTDLQGLTQAEAADRLALSVSGMKSRVQRGRLKFRELFDACCRIQLDARGSIADYERRSHEPCDGDGDAPSCGCGCH